MIRYIYIIQISCGMGCLKYRQKVLRGTVEVRLNELIIQICSNINVDVIKMEIMPYHLTFSVQ